MGDGKTPIGTLRPLSAFGVKPNPGTTVRARRCTPTSRSITKHGVHLPQRQCHLHPCERLEDLHRRLHCLRRGPHGRDTEELRHVAGHQSDGITDNKN